MQTALQITFRHLPHSDALEARVRERAAELDGFFAHIISCRVSIEQQARHKHLGRTGDPRGLCAIPSHRRGAAGDGRYARPAGRAAPDDRVERFLACPGLRTG